MPNDRPTNVLVLACYFKGERFLQRLHERGANVYLLTQERIKDKAWPREAITEMIVQPDHPPLEWTIHTVSYLARRVRIDRLVGLDDYDQEVAAALREHLRMPGMNESTARFFRDKLACRMKAKEKGLPVPEFTPVFNDAEVAEFIARVPAPWMLKPRSEVSATGIHKVKSADELWPLLASKGDRRSFMLLEQYLPGDVYHADALTSEGKVVFSEVHRCGSPPFDVAHGGGIFSTVTLDRKSEEARSLRALNEKVLLELGQWRGASHVEFIKSRENGRFYLLETACRVGGAHIAETVEAATGVNLWQEWANLELDAGAKPYELPARREEYAGLLMTLAKQDRPDLSRYDAPEVVFQAPEPNHAGMVMRSKDRARVVNLLTEYERRFREDFMTYLPPAEKATH